MYPLPLSSEVDLRAIQYHSGGDVLNLITKNDFTAIQYTDNLISWRAV